MERVEALCAALQVRVRVRARARARVTLALTLTLTPGEQVLLYFSGWG